MKEGGNMPTQHSIISPDLKIKGDLVSSGDIKVEGSVEGSISCRTLTLGDNPVLNCNRFGFFLDLTGVWCIGVPLAFFGAFYLGLPVYWVMALIAVEEFYKLGIGIPRFFSRKWIQNLVAG